MRRIVTHKSSDLDAITSVWLLKRFYSNWDGAEVEFVNAGEGLPGHQEADAGNFDKAIEVIDEVETIHVDTGMGALDHHQTADNNTCGASLTLQYVLSNPDSNLPKHEIKCEAVKRIVELVIDDDHFQEMYYPQANHDIYELGIVAIIQGYKLNHQKDDKALTEFTMECLDAILQNLEKKIWAEREIAEKGIEFESKWGRALAIETINDEVLKHAQMSGFRLAVRKDPNGGFVRIKTVPDKRKPASPASPTPKPEPTTPSTNPLPASPPVPPPTTPPGQPLSQPASIEPSPPQVDTSVPVASAVPSMPEVTSMPPPAGENSLPDGTFAFNSNSKDIPTTSAPATPTAGTAVKAKGKSKVSLPIIIVLGVVFLVVWGVFWSIILGVIKI